VAKAHRPGDGPSSWVGPQVGVETSTTAAALTFAGVQGAVKQFVVGAVKSGLRHWKATTPGPLGPKLALTLSRGLAGEVNAGEFEACRQRAQDKYRPRSQQIIPTARDAQSRWCQSNQPASRNLCRAPSGFRPSSQPSPGPGSEQQPVPNRDALIVCIPADRQAEEQA